AEVAFIDLDEDGDLDPVTRVFGAIYENENTANLSFGFNQLNAPGFNSFDLIAGDVDKDGIDDMSILRAAGDYTSFYRFEIVEDETGRVVSEDVIEFRTSGGGGLLETEGEVSDIHLADFDGDGFEDLLVITETGANPGNDFLFPGSSTGITDTPTSLNLSEDNGFHRVAASDLDGDGDLDIVSQRFTDASETVGLDVLLNDGTGTFTISETLQLGGGAREADFKIGDVDGDGLKDIVTSHAYDSNTKFAITVWSNDGDGTFSQSQALEDTKGSQLELIDIDADDDLDILIRVDSDDQLRVFENTNEAPTQISLSADSFDEELALDTEIATITVTDENQKDTHVVSLVTGDGVNDAQNGFFDVDGDRLILTRLVDFETITSLNLYLSANDGNGNTFEQALTLTVNDIAEPEPEEPLGLSPEESLNALGIYPNPGTNQITFDFTHDLVGEMKIKVRDLSGKLVRSIAAEKTGETWKGTIDMADATPGAYLVALTIGSNETVFQRWIKK
ncbi:MAG: FG-GAP-like repeat-containing protein, partial [Bacteroidota bacterium]